MVSHPADHLRLGGTVTPVRLNVRINTDNNVTVGPYPAIPTHPAG